MQIFSSHYKIFCDINFFFNYETMKIFYFFFVIAKIANLEDQRVRDFHNIGAIEESRVWDGMGEWEKSEGGL